jgi:glucokinase
MPRHYGGRENEQQRIQFLAVDIGGTKTNLALRMLAFSGIYLGGGIPPRRPLNERQAVR